MAPPPPLAAALLRRCLWPNLTQPALLPPCRYHGHRNDAHLLRGMRSGRALVTVRSRSPCCCGVVLWRLLELPMRPYPPLAASLSHTPQVRGGHAGLGGGPAVAHALLSGGALLNALCMLPLRPSPPVPGLARLRTRPPPALSLLPMQRCEGLCLPAERAQLPAAQCPARRRGGRVSCCQRCGLAADSAPRGMRCMLLPCCPGLLRGGRASMSGATLRLPWAGVLCGRHRALPLPPRRAPPAGEVQRQERSGRSVFTCMCWLLCMLHSVGVDTARQGAVAVGTSSRPP